MTTFLPPLDTGHCAAAKAGCSGEAEGKGVTSEPVKPWLYKKPGHVLMRRPTAANNVTMARFVKSREEGGEEDEWWEREGEEPPPMDMIRQRPCTPNNQYSCMNPQQISRLQRRSRANPAFYYNKLPWIPDKRYYMDRYARCTCRHLLRYTQLPGSEPSPMCQWCWLDPHQWWREPPDLHDTSRPGAALPWGVEKAGCSTYSHFDGEDTHRYVHMDVYCRPPTNMPGPVLCKFGRAASYYHQRRPNSFTWFGSTHQLNIPVLKDIQPKALHQYQLKWRGEQRPLLERRAMKMWPDVSEYVDRFSLRTGMPQILTRLEQNKEHVAQSRTPED